MSSAPSRQSSRNPLQEQQITSSSTITTRSMSARRQIHERVSSLNSLSADERRRIEIQEEDTMSDSVGDLIHEFLSRPNRRRPYNSLFRWSVNDGTILQYHVVLKIEQDPPSTTS